MKKIIPAVKNTPKTALLTPFEALTQEIQNSDKYKKRTLESLDWYRKKIRAHFGAGDETSTSDPREVIKKVSPDWSLRNFTQEFPGWFYTFVYKPKHKDTLPYYDKFPLVLILELLPDGFVGLNMHYLPTRDRAFFMDRLYHFEKPDRSVKGQLRIDITYEILKQRNQLAYYKPCIKRYLYSQIGGFFIPIYSHEWPIALFLPTENFAKKTLSEVHNESKKKYRGFV